MPRRDQFESRTNQVLKSPHWSHKSLENIDTIQLEKLALFQMEQNVNLVLKRNTVHLWN